MPCAPSGTLCDSPPSCNLYEASQIGSTRYEEDAVAVARWVLAAGADANPAIGEFRVETCSSPLANIK